MNIEKCFKAFSGKPNDSKSEQEFRETCLLYNSQYITFHKSPSKDYQSYLNHYHHIASLYLVYKEHDSDTTKLFIYDTENEAEHLKILDIQETLNELTSITQLPSGDLFCFGNYPPNGLTLILDMDFKTRVLPFGNFSCNSSIIYFDNNVYCFGGWDYDFNELALSSRFDLNENRWINISPMIHPEFFCNSAIYNRNILISGSSRNLLLYSIDIDSFSKIPYDFANERKIVINAERLYLIECFSDGFIYESEDEYNWEKISNSLITKICPIRQYWTYNKGGIYIGALRLNFELSYDFILYKFDLKRNEMIKLTKEKSLFNLILNWK